MHDCVVPILLSENDFFLLTSVSIRLFKFYKLFLGMLINEKLYIMNIAKLLFATIVHQYAKPDIFSKQVLQASIIFDLFGKLFKCFFP